MYHAIFLAFAAVTLGVPMPEDLPVVYPQVPEQQICALVTGQPCNPIIEERESDTAWLGVMGDKGEWAAVANMLPTGSLYWQGVMVHEMAHVVQFASWPDTAKKPECVSTYEHQANLVMEKWFYNRGFTHQEVVGFELPPYEYDEKVVAVCGSPALPETGENHEHGTESAP